MEGRDINESLLRQLTPWATTFRVCTDV